MMEMEDLSALDLHFILNSLQKSNLSIPLEKVAKYKGKENTDVEVDVAIVGKATFYGI